MMCFLCRSVYTEDVAPDYEPTKFPWTKKVVSSIPTNDQDSFLHESESSHTSLEDSIEGSQPDNKVGLNPKQPDILCGATSCATATVAVAGNEMHPQVCSLSSAESLASDGSTQHHIPDISSQSELLLLLSLNYLIIELVFSFLVLVFTEFNAKIVAANLPITRKSMSKLVIVRPSFRAVGQKKKKQVK